MESYIYLDGDKAIETLQKLKKKNKKCKVIICTTDYDNNIEGDTKISTPDEGCVLIRKSKTIIINEDTFIQHMQLFSKKQNFFQFFFSFFSLFSRKFAIALDYQ